MNDYLSFFVTSEYLQSRLDIYIDKQMELENREVSRTLIQKLIDTEQVFVNGEHRSKSYRVSEGDFITILLPEPEDDTTKAEDIPLDILYEDEYLLVVNKEKGMVVHPAVGHTGGTLVNAVLYHCEGELSGIGGVKRPGIVHRIDKDTSGLLVIAKNDISHASLAQQLHNHTMRREYQAVCHGALKQETGIIDLPIARYKNNRKKFSVDEEGKNALTEYTLIQNYDKFAYLSLKLQTGRTHQIRVHMAYIHHPIAGDTVYGPKDTPKELKGQCLHAKTLAFVHPKTKELMEFDSELPEYFLTFLQKIS